MGAARTLSGVLGAGAASVVGRVIENSLENADSGTQGLSLKKPRRNRLTVGDADVDFVRSSQRRILLKAGVGSA
ncbi:hypothetical protein GCM10010439_58410 [Actinocorallia aurantiaca]|uniref:Uncharacterized protein n=1 Tax=Actinocorallia aurantiaca TaxID=46204 RepID=A0ABP6H3S3_9ACTN